LKSQFSDSRISNSAIAIEMHREISKKKSVFWCIAQKEKLIAKVIAGLVGVKLAENSRI